MYFNKDNEDTNIDKEFKKKKIEFDFQKYRTPIIIVGAILLLIIIILIIFALLRNRPRYYIALDGPEEITVIKGSTYTEPGYKGYDNKNKTYTVKVLGEVDTSTPGTYEIAYTLHNVTKKRIVKVIEEPDKYTTIHLNEGKSITVKKGSKYTDPGYSATDIIDGDLTDSVKVSGTVDTSKIGIYRITYTVTNSKDITTIETRVVTVE